MSRDLLNATVSIYAKLVLTASFRVSTISDIQHKELITTHYFKWSPRFIISSTNNLKLISGLKRSSKLCLFTHLKLVTVLNNTYQDADLRLIDAAFMSLIGFYKGGNY